MTAISVRMRHLGAGTAASAVLLLYIATLAPGIAFIDAGELIAVTHSLGIAHPTGYPTFTMLGWLWSQLPLGSAAVRMNLFSAVLCAAAVYVLVHLLWLLLGVTSARKLPQRRGPQQRKAKQGNGQSLRAQQVPGDAMRLVLAMFGALFIGVSRTFWGTGLSIEVYSLHMLVVALTLLTFTRAVFETAPDERAKRRRLGLFALMLGLAFTNHMTMVMLLPAFIVLYFWKNGINVPAWRGALSAAPFFFIGLLPYLYLPLRAMSGPALNWGNPATLLRLFWHMSGKQYSVWMFEGSEVANRQLSLFFTTFPAEFAYVGLLLVIPGVVFAFLRNRRLGAMLLLLFATCLFWAINYNINDIESYFLLAYVVAGIWAALAAAGLLALARTVKPLHAAGAGLALLVALAGVQFGAVSERDDHLVDDYTANMFRSMKPNALVLSYQWDNWLSASYTRQLLEGQRPDVAIIDKELLRRSWYFDQLRRAHPDIYRRSEAEIRAFLIELHRFEHNEPYRVEDIEKRYNNLINSIVERNYDTRPVYTAREIESHLAPGFRRVPEGMLFRIYRPADVPSPEQPVPEAFTFRPFERRGRLENAMMAEYASMLLARGRYLTEFKLHRLAEPYYDRALDIRVGDPEMQDGLRNVILKWKRKNDAP